MTVLARRRLLDTRLGQLHVRLAGEEGGPLPPLVLLHMSPLSGHMFDAVLPALAADRLVVLPDRIGFGQSDRLVAPVSLPEIAAATVDALDALGIGAYDVFGIHTGSCEAVEHAVAEGDRVRRVGCTAGPALNAGEVAAFKVLYGSPPVPAPDGSHLARYWDWWREAGPEWPAELRWARVRDQLIAGPDVWWTHHAVFDYPLADRIARVAQPLLVLAPRDDVWMQSQRPLPALPAGATVVAMPHADSELFDLCTDEVAGHLREFFA